MKIKILFLCLALTVSCTANSTANIQSAPANQNNANTAGQTGASNETKKNDTSQSAPQNTATISKATDENCGTFKLDGKMLIKNQSFPFNFEPFSHSCFVTFGDKELMLDEKDVARGSKFYIFKDGKQVYEFPDAFGGQEACWIEGASFVDLNGDGLTDVIIAGNCLAAKDSYPSNAVYVNSGKDFTTSADANSKLDNFSKLKDIESFVKKNQKIFF